MRLLLLFVAAVAGAQPLRLHPANPHYFEYRGKPAVLVTSAEHYGAVLNLDFNYKRYLDTLWRDGLNNTRIFVGNYREIPGSFNISQNTLAPKPDRFIAPWPQAEGKFDLNKWNDAYFARLKDFMRHARRRGVIVEVNLFCPFYEEALWRVSPMNEGTGVKREEVFTLKHARLTAVQERLTRKIVSELRGFDNLYYEIANEPYFGGITLEWQAHIAKTIHEVDGGRHLISQNIANGSVKIGDPNPLVSILNFHYSRPPDSIALNYGLNRAVGNNETGFDGTGDAVYRIQGWDFLIAGGALYNNLDYSFVAGHEDGTFEYPRSQPGGGSAALRKQLGILKRFMDSFRFVRMAPVAVEGARVLAEPGRQYAVYMHHGRAVKDAKPQYQVDGTEREAQVTLDLPAGRYRAEWVDTRTGAIAYGDTFDHGGGKRALVGPRYREDIALRVVRH
jgi:hypothetical protein